jgi:uncharacterized protein (TIGR03067 family)
MSKFLRCSFLAAFFVSTHPVWGDDAKGDEDKLQGTWQVTEGVSDGKPVPKEQLARMKVVFSGKKMSIFPPVGDGKRTVENTFTVDPGKKPRAIDATRLEGGGKGKIARGIYDLDGDTLKLCLTSRLEMDRPNEFAAPEKSGLVLLTLKRVKK